VVLSSRYAVNMNAVVFPSILSNQKKTETLGPNMDRVGWVHEDDVELIEQSKGDERRQALASASHHRIYRKN
jgi:hypothetical protein